MKRYLKFTVLSAVLVLISSGLFFAGDPVPDGSISLDEIPGGTIKRGTTNRSGMVTFDNLKPGNYRITFVAGKNKPANTPSYKKSGPEDKVMSESHGSSQSNVKPTISPNGRTECEVGITLIYGSGPKTPDKPVLVTIGPKGGKITVRVDKEVVTPKESSK